MSNSTFNTKKSKLSLWDHIVFRILIIPAFMFMWRIRWATGSNGNPITAAKAEKRGKAYLEENYPGVYELVNTQNSGDASQRQDGTWHIYYFSRAENSNMFSGMGKLSFSLVFDENLNLITDGYKEYYLKGGSVYSQASSDFYRDVVYLFDTPFKNQDILIEGNFKERLDDTDFNDIGFYEAGDGYIYTGDYLDPEKEHDLDELSAKYGHINLKFFMESGGYDDYAEAVNAVVNILKENNQPYHSLRIYMWFRDSDIIFCEGNFTKEEIDADTQAAVKDGTFTFTQVEYDRRKASGEEMPNIEVGSLKDLLAEVYQQASDTD